MKRLAVLPSFAALLLAGHAVASPSAVWAVKGTPARSLVTGGPWVLAEGNAAEPMAGYPAANAGTAAMQPYYQAFVTGDFGHLQGYFDYRIKDTEEAVVAASSTDQGATWTFQSKVADFTSPSITTPGAAADDGGEGHPFVLTVGGHTRLYTLDRSTPAVDSAGLIVRELTPSASDPLVGAPPVAEVGSTTVTRTIGLVEPDGIMALVPGTASPVSVLYLAKDITQTPIATSLHLVDTMDGITFQNDRLVSGITDSVTTFVGPRGSLLKFEDGRYGLFFSAGLVGEDADAFHYVGYAESSDLLTWTVVNGVDHPLLSTDAAKDPTGGQGWYAGRVYAPNVILAAGGCSAIMSVSGYSAAKPKAALGDYRQIGALSLTRPCAMGATDAGIADAAPTDGSTEGADAGRPATTPDASDGPSAPASDGNSGGCATSPGSTGFASGALLLAITAFAVRTRRRMAIRRRLNHA